MVPTLFHLGRFGVPTHAFFLTLGVLVATGVFLFEARRRGRLDFDVVTIMSGALFFGAVGAKLATVWRYLDRAPDPTFLGAMVDGGKSILGGLAGAYIGALLVKRLIGYKQSTGDIFAPAVALGMAVGRIGCFLTEQIGTPTSAPWGIAVGPEVAARIPMCPGCAPGITMHPSFLYEILFQAAIFVVLWKWRDRIPVPGELFKIYLVGYAVFRFGVEFVRGNETVAAGLSGPQLFLVPSILLLVIYFARQLNRNAYGQKGVLIDQRV